jgi:hypothetical protein
MGVGKIVEEIQDNKPKEDEDSVKIPIISQEQQQIVTKYPPRKKTKLYLELVAVIIVSLIIFALIFIFVLNPGTETIDPLISLDFIDEDSVGVNIIAGSGNILSVAGTANLQIFYEDEEVFSSNVRINDDGSGFISVPYTSFIEGNGEYLFIANYRDRQGPPRVYNVEFIVEKLDIGALVEYIDGEGIMTVNIFTVGEGFRGYFINPENAILTVNEIKRVEDNSFITSGDPPEIISQNYVQYEYPYNKSGNYVIKVSLENTRVNPDSPYRNITETREYFLNIIPQAKAVITNIYPSPNSTNYTVEFDASSSWNDGYITKYIWDLDGNGTIDLETTEPFANFSRYVQGEEYYVNLNVEGDVEIYPYRYMEKGALTIHVSYP